MSTVCFLDYCLVCDRQTPDSPYCSQKCRLAELDGRQSDASEPSTQWSKIQPTLSTSASQTSLTSQSPCQDEMNLRDYASWFDPIRDLKRRMTTA